MKSVSVKDLESLKNDGWQISSADLNVISGQINSQKVSAAAAAAVVSSLENISKTIAGIEIPEVDLKPLLDTHVALISQLIETRPTKWVFDIKRNNNGFISEVVANAK